MLAQQVVDLLHAYAHDPQQPTLTAALRPARLAARGDPAFRSALGSSTSFWAAFGSVWANHARLLADEDATAAEPVATLASFLASLVAGAPESQANALTYVEPHLRAVLVTTSSFVNLGDDDYTGTTKACCQALSNLVTNNETVAATYFPKCLVWTGSDDIISRLMDSSDPAILLAVLVFLLNSIFASAERSLLLASSPAGVKLLDRVLVLAAVRFDGETEKAFVDEEFASDVFGVTYAIVRQLIVEDAFPVAFAGQASSSDFDLVSSQLILLKFLDGYLHSLPPDVESSAATTAFLLATLAKLSTSVQESGKVMDERDAATCSALVLVVHCLSSIGLATTEGRTGCVDCMESTVALLAWTDRINKEQRASSDAAAWVEPEALSQLKRSCVRLLGVVCYDQQEAQDRIRECGGLTLLLGMCQIDDTNLTLREHAMFAIRNILHNNATNQEIVAGMKAQYLVGPTGQIQDLPPALR